jgi:PAS domain S-box-containing protein
MTIQFTQISSAFMFAALMSLFLAVFIWSRRHILGAPSLVMLLLVVAWWMFGSAMQNSVQDPAGILFWFKFQSTGLQFLPQAWLYFVLQYTGVYGRISRYQIWLLGIPASLAAVLIWTNDLHLLFWLAPLADIVLNSAAGFQSFGAGQWLSILFRYLYFLTATYLLIKDLATIRREAPYTSLLLLAGTFPAWLINVYLLASPHDDWVRNATPLLYLVSTILFITALVRYRLLNIIPIAFEALIAGMGDGMLVLDLNRIIMHLNPSAERILGISLQRAIGKPVEKVLSTFPDLLALCCHNQHENSDQIPLNTSQGRFYYEVVISPIRDRWENPIGRIVVLHNITKRVTAEDSSRQSQALLLRSEETYRQLIENINEVVFILDCDRVYSYVSPVIERYTGYQPNEINGQPFDRFVHPDDRTVLQSSLDKVMSGENSTGDFRMIDKAGKEHYVHANYRRLIQDGKTAGLQGMLTDVTEYHRAQEALEWQALQLSMLNYIGEQIAAVMELDSILNSATNLIQSNFGYYHVALFLPDHESSSLVMRSAAGAFTSIFPPNHRLKYRQGIIGWVAENHNLLLVNDVGSDPRYVNFFPDKIVTCSELAVPVMLYDELVGVLDIQSPQFNGFNENDVRALKTVADQIAVAIGNARLYDQLRLQLKEREYKENILRIQRDLFVSLSSFTRLEEMLQQAVKQLALEMHVPLAEIFLLDPNGQYLQIAASQGTEETANQPMPVHEGIVGWVVRNASPALVADVREVPHYLEVSPQTHSEISAPLINGELVIGVINLESPEINAFTQDDLRLLTILANNLVVLIERARLFSEVERARAELETRAHDLETANERLRELDRLKSQFLANMSHELRTPLNSIIGFSEVIYDEVTGPINEDQREYVRYIYESGKHLLELINDLLDFSKIEAGRMQLEPTTFYISGLLEEVHSILSPQIEKKSQQIFFVIEAGVPAITADRLRMRQVFFNLLSNANKFTPPSGSIYVTCRPDAAGRIRFAVTDTGIGIKPEDQKMIFEEFRQVDGSLTREVSGTGLGLAISKRIVELHHGSIWVESQYGQGSTFYISLPVNDCTDMI